MRKVQLALIALWILSPTAGLAAGLVSSENFIVMAPDQNTAQVLLEQAEHFRTLVAQEWLGEELPPGVGRAVIHLEVSDTEDTGRTWPIDTPDRRFHKLWLVTSVDRALGDTLHHEVTHVVFATQFPNRMPAWAEEGAASSSDDADRMATRRRIVEWFASSGNWPNLQVLLDMQSIGSADQEAYSAACSLTEYLIGRGGKQKFVRFAGDGKRDGWSRALKEHYGFHTVRDLQAGWQSWASSAE
jgi:hypothetical protein